MILSPTGCVSQPPLQKFPTFISVISSIGLKLVNCALVAKTFATVGKGPTTVGKQIYSHTPPVTNRMLHFDPGGQETSKQSNSYGTGNFSNGYLTSFRKYFNVHPVKQCAIQRELTYLMQPTTKYAQMMYLI